MKKIHNWPIRIEHKNQEIRDHSPANAIWAVFWSDGGITVTYGGLHKTLAFIYRQIKEQLTS